MSSATRCPQGKCTIFIHSPTLRSAGGWGHPPLQKTGLPVGNPVYYFLYTQAVGAGFFS